MQGRSVYSIPQIFVFSPVYIKANWHWENESYQHSNPEPGAFQIAWWCHLKSCWDRIPPESPVLKASRLWVLNHIRKETRLTEQQEGWMLICTCRAPCQCLGTSLNMNLYHTSLSEAEHSSQAAHHCAVGQKWSEGPGCPSCSMWKQQNGIPTLIRSFSLSLKLQMWQISVWHPTWKITDQWAKAARWDADVIRYLYYSER